MNIVINWDAIILACIAAIPPTIAAFAAWVQARKTKESVDGRMTELLELTRRQATDEATLVEKKAAHARKGDAAIAKSEREKD